MSTQTDPTSQLDLNGLIRLTDAEIGYRKPLLKPLSMTVHRGVRLAVLGPNGGGKSTLLKTLIGIVPLLSGQLSYPAGRRPRIGYVPQAHRADLLFPLSAEEVVLQGRFALIGVGRFATSKDKAEVKRQLEAVGMGDRGRVPFRSMSGGQRQRVLLARALAGDPELLVLDEFTSDLDPAAASAILKQVAALAEQAKVSVMFVTHEISDAAAWSNEVAFVDSRRGVFMSGTTDEMLTSERLTHLYGQPVQIERRGGRTIVHVEAGAAE